jgi:hypothetical protein
MHVGCNFTYASRDEFWPGHFLFITRRAALMMLVINLNVTLPVAVTSHKGTGEREKERHTAWADERAVRLFAYCMGNEKRTV